MPSRTQIGDTTMSGLTIETGILNVSLGNLYLFPCFLQAKGSSCILKMVTRSNFKDTFLSVWRGKWWFEFWSQPPFVKDRLIPPSFLDLVVHSMLHRQGYDMDNNSHNLSHPFPPLCVCLLPFSPHPHSTQSELEPSILFKFNSGV